MKAAIRYWRVQVALYGLGVLINRRRFPARMDRYLALPRNVRLNSESP